MHFFVSLVRFVLEFITRMNKVSAGYAAAASYLTFEIQPENGMPSSRAKANSCLDEPAITVTLPKKPRMMINEVMALVDERLPVVL
jgi:hypothetical protein